MSDPTQAGADPTPPQPGPNSYTLTDWIKILHNGAQVTPDHPQYANVRQLMGEALARVAEMHMAQNHADSLAAQPGPVSSGLMGAAQGMSMGLGTSIPPFSPGTPQADAFKASGQPNEQAAFLAQARAAHPVPSGVGNALGGAAPATILAGMGVPGPVAMGAPAALQTGLETDSPLAAAGAGLGTAVAGKALGKLGQFLGLGPLVDRAVAALASKFAAKTTTELGEKIGAMSVDEIRAALTKQKFGTPEQIEQAIQAMQKSMERTASGGVTLTPRAGESLNPIPGSPKGFEVTGARKTPPVPTTPTITEIQDRLAGARASYARHTAESLLPRTGELPQPQGASLTPKAGSIVPGAAEEEVPEPFRLSRQIAGEVSKAETQLGRSLSAQERAQLLEHIMGRFNPRPGHPFFFGEGAPTPRGPVQE